MLEHIADFTAWPILTEICIGYVANRIMSGEGKGYLTNFVFCAGREGYSKDYQRR
jgi:hypothetical protein